jgi:YVTN family beta-propeller protein
MMRRLLLIISLAFTSCTNSSLEPKNTDNYPANISSIIQANCLGGNCHTGSTPLNTRFDLSSWDAMTKGSIYLNEIIPFTAVKSHLFGHINTNKNIAPVIDPTMPLARDPLSAGDQKSFFDWINLGAKSADGKFPYSDVTKKIFIINQAEDMFSVIDANTQKVVRIIPIGDTAVKYKPASIAMMPDHSSFVVAMLGAKGAVRKYDQTSYIMTGEFASNLLPNEIALTPNGSKGYITDNSSLTSNKFGVFDPQAMSLTKTISSPLILQPFAVTVAPDGNYAYMSGYSSDNILRIDTRTDSVVGNLPLGSDVLVPVTQDYIRQYLPSKIVISSDSKRMYVTCVNTSEVVVFDLQKDSIISRIKLPNSPRAEALSPDGKELWAATWVNTIHVISTQTNQIIAEVDSVSQSPSAMMFTPDRKYVYVACQYLLGGHHHASNAPVAPSSYVVIDAATRKILYISELPGISVGIVGGFGN